MPHDTNTLTSWPNTEYCAQLHSPYLSSCSWPSPSSHCHTHIHTSNLPFSMGSAKIYAHRYFFCQGRIHIPLTLHVKSVKCPLGYAGAVACSLARYIPQSLYIHVCLSFLRVLGGHLATKVFSCFQHESWGSHIEVGSLHDLEDRHLFGRFIVDMLVRFLLFYSEVKVPLTAHILF